MPTSFHLSDCLSCDIRYADDTALVALMFEKLELSTNGLEYACRKWGMKINTGKTSDFWHTGENQNRWSWYWKCWFIHLPWQHCTKLQWQHYSENSTCRTVFWKITSGDLEKQRHQFEFKSPSVQFTDCANSYVCCWNLDFEPKRIRKLSIPLKCVVFEEFLEWLF